MLHPFCQVYKESECIATQTQFHYMYEAIIIILNRFTYNHQNSINTKNCKNVFMLQVGFKLQMNKNVIKMNSTLTDILLGINEIEVSQYVHIMKGKTLWHIVPLLASNSEISNYTPAITRQCPGNIKRLVFSVVHDEI